MIKLCWCMAFLLHLCWLLSKNMLGIWFVAVLCLQEGSVVSLDGVVPRLDSFNA